MHHDKICIVIPVYNNPKSIQKIIHQTLQMGFHTIVIDDGSDIPLESYIEKNFFLTLLRHDTNLGKGRAIMTAAKVAKKRGFEYIVTIDADGQHYPSEIDAIIPLISENTIVIGSRNFKKNVPNISKFGRVFSNFWIYTETGKWLKDTQSGFRGYPLSILDLNLKHLYYDFEIEVIVKHIWSGGAVNEVGIKVYYPPKEERISHFDKIKDNIRLSKIHSKLLLQNILRLSGF